MSKERIVVAYSGGLDTSVMVRWLIENKNAEVITFTGDLGHSRELSGVKEKAIATGATRAYVSDLKKEFLEEYVFPALKAGAVYEKAYVMATSLGRPLLAKGLVELDNVVLTPHTGSATFEAREGMSRMAAANLISALKGERPANLVNPSVLENDSA